MTDRQNTAEELVRDATADVRAGTGPTGQEAAESAAAYAVSLQRLEVEFDAIGQELAELRSSR